MPEWLTNIPMDFWKVLGEMAPYLLFGFFIAGLLSVLISPRFIERHLGGGGVWPVIKASAFGVPLPLCSCGVIPVATSIRKHGASKGATTAFLISTPQTGADSILATFSLLGPVFAIYRPIAALISGVLGGAIVSGAEKDTPTDQPAKCNDVCCSTTEVKRSATVRAFGYGFVTLPRDIARMLLLGLAVAALISAIIPKDYFSTFVPPGPLQILVLMMVGIPIYICATASIPIAAGLILAGVSPGAAFALLMTGPATNAATLATIWKVMGKQTCLIYLGTMMVAAFIGGLVLDQIVTTTEVQTAMHHGWMPVWIKAVSGVALLVVLGVGVFYRPRSQEKNDAPESSETLRLKIDGMTCSHCTDSVRGALSQCEGVTWVDVDLPGGEATVTGSGLDSQSLSVQVDKAGYRVTDVWNETDKENRD